MNADDLAAVLQFVDIYMPEELVTAWDAPINKAHRRLGDTIGWPVLPGEPSDSGLSDGPFSSSQSTIGPQRA